MPLIRLQKHIADLGIASRRKAEDLIASGRVLVNDDVANLGMKIDPAIDTLKIQKYHHAENIPTKEPKIVYIALNKPVGYISSTSSEQGQSVLELLTKEHNIGKNKRTVQARVYPVGRLDKDSEGLILLTNDGELTNELTHPRYEHEKEYEVTIDKPLSRDAHAILTKGMTIDNEKVKRIVIKKEFNKGKRTIITAILTEGKNRQIRKMFGNLGYTVFSLRRIRIHNLRLATLPIGSWKFVKKTDIIG